MKSAWRKETPTSILQSVLPPLTRAKKKSGDWSLRFCCSCSVRGFFEPPAERARTFFSIFIVGFVLLEFHCLLVLEVHPWVCSEVFFSLIVSRDWNFFWVLGCAVWTFVPRLNSYRNAFHATACGSTWRKPRRRRTEKIARLEFSWAPFAVTSRWWNNEGSWELQVIACEFCVLVWAAFRPLKKWRIWRVFNKDNAKRLGGICGFSWFVCLCCRICEFVQFGHWACPFLIIRLYSWIEPRSYIGRTPEKKSMADSSQW